MLTIRVNVASTIAKLDRLGPEARVATKDWMRKQGRLLISSSGKVPGLVQVTQPMNANAKGAKALAIGKRAIDRDLARVFAPVKIKGRRKITQVFGQQMKRPKFVQTKEMHPDVDAIHSARFKRKTDKGGKMTRGRAQAYYVDVKKLEATRKRLHARVGRLASAVVGAGERALGPLNGVPAFVRRHSSNLGAVALLEDNRGIRVRAANYATAANAELQRRFNRVAEYRFRAMERELPYMARALEKKFQPLLK